MNINYNKYIKYKYKYLFTKDYNLIGGNNISNSYNLCCQEYIFYKYFQNSIQKFNEFFNKNINTTNLIKIDNLVNIDPFTECEYIFIQTTKSTETQFVNNISWDPVIHSFYIDEQNNKYIFSDNIKNLIIDKLTFIFQQKLYLDKIYEAKNSTINNIKNENFNVKDIAINFYNNFNISVTSINNFINLCKTNNSIDNIENIQQDILNETKLIIKNFIIKENGIYDYYCSVRCLFDKKILYKEIINNHAIIKLSIENDFYIISFYDDIINIKIHKTRYFRLLHLYLKYLNIQSINEQEKIIFHEHLYACIRRYRTIFWLFKVFFGNSMPPETFKLWKEMFKNRNIVECFADPFNCYLDEYYSPFNDVDKYFGSIGSFFDNPPTEGCAIAHPPTEKNFLNQTIIIIMNILKNKQNKITFILGLPLWKKYLKTEAHIIAETYPSFGIKTNSLTLTNSDLETVINSKKTYSYKYKLYILSNDNTINFNVKYLEYKYTNIFLNYGK